MLEVPRKQSGREAMRIPDDEAVPSSAPGNNGIGGRILDHFECLGEEGRRTGIVQSFHGLREA